MCTRVSATRGAKCRAAQQGTRLIRRRQFLIAPPSSIHCKPSALLRLSHSLSHICCTAERHRSRGCTAEGERQREQQKKKVLKSKRDKPLGRRAAGPPAGATCRSCIVRQDMSMPPCTALRRSAQAINQRFFLSTSMISLFSFSRDLPSPSRSLSLSLSRVAFAIPTIFHLQLMAQSLSAVCSAAALTLRNASAVSSPAVTFPLSLPPPSVPPAFSLRPLFAMALSAARVAALCVLIAAAAAHPDLDNVHMCEAQRLKREQKRGGRGCC